MKQEQKYSIPKLEKCRSWSINQDGLGPGRKIKNKRSFEKLKIDGVKIAYLSLNQKLRNCNKNQQCNDWNGWIRLLTRSIHRLRSLLLRPIPMKSVVVTTTIPAIFKEYVGIRQFMGQPRNIIQYSIFHTSSLLLKESGSILKGIQVK